MLRAAVLCAVAMRAAAALPPPAPAASCVVDGTVIYDVAVSPDGAHVAVASVEALRLYDGAALAAGECRITWSVAAFAVSLAWAPNGEWLAAGLGSPNATTLVFGGSPDPPGWSAAPANTLLCMVPMCSYAGDNAVAGAPSLPQRRTVGGQQVVKSVSVAWSPTSRYLAGERGRHVASWSAAVRDGGCAGERRGSPRSRVVTLS